MAPWGGRINEKNMRVARGCLAARWWDLFCSGPLAGPIQRHDWSGRSERVCCLTRKRSSGVDGGLKRSTQHFFSDARDGVDRRWVEDMFEVSMRCGRGGVEEPLAVRIRSSTEWLGNSMNGRARLCASKPEPNEI